MDYLLQKLHKWSDPRIKNWWLTGYHSPVAVSMILFTYLLLGFIIFPIIRRRRRRLPNLENFMGIHNGLLVLLNLTLASLYFWHLQKAKYSLWCQPVVVQSSSSSYFLSLTNLDDRRGYDETKICELQWWYLTLKIFELVDLLFATCRKVPLASTEFMAHTYHHATMLILCWAGAKYLPGGSTAIMSTLNCSTHVVLYFYYLLRSTLKSMGILNFVPASFKPVVALVTLFQFLFVLVHCVSGLFWSCGYPGGAFITVILLVTSYLESFYGFGRLFILQNLNRHQQLPVEKYSGK